MPKTLLSFSGLDGSGKSHQIDRLVDTLTAMGEPPVVIWMPFRIWPEPLLAWLPADLRSKLGPKRSSSGDAAAERTIDDVVAATPPPRRTRPLVKALWTVTATVAAASAALSLRRRIGSADGEVVIFDRYRLDTIVKLQYWYPEVSARWLAAVVNRLTPSPDVEIFLRVPAEVAYARKPEQFSVKQLAKQAARYDAVTDASGVLVVDGQQSREEIEEFISSRVRERLGVAA